MKKTNLDMRTRVSYKAAYDQRIVAKIVYEWLKTTKARRPFKILRDWKDGILFLMIDVTKLKYVNSIMRPEGDLFMKKYVAKYMGIK